MVSERRRALAVRLGMKKLLIKELSGPLHFNAVQSNLKALLGEEPKTFGALLDELPSDVRSILSDNRQSACATLMQVCMSAIDHVGFTKTTNSTIYEDVEVVLNPKRFPAFLPTGN